MRPPKPRHIESPPPWERYLPQGRREAADMTLGLDMYEALRLVDAEGLSQEAAAERMGVSTPTLCRLLGEARRRVATALRDGWALRCEGGNVRLRPGGHGHGHGPAWRHGHGGGAACAEQSGGDAATAAGREAIHERGRGRGGRPPRRMSEEDTAC